MLSGNLCYPLCEVLPACIISMNFPCLHTHRHACALH